MRISGIHLRGHEHLPNLSFMFKRGDGKVSDSICIDGPCGSGKSLLLDLISRAWAGSVRGRGSSWKLRAEMCRVDFEVGGEILAVHIRGENVEGSNKLAVLYEQRHQMVLKYDISRVNRLMGGSTEPTGVSSIYPIISDLHRQDFRDSVVLIDDFDTGLGSTVSFEFFKYLKRHLLSRGNQLIISGCSTESFNVDQRIILGNGIDPLERSLALLGE